MSWHASNPISTLRDRGQLSLGPDPPSPELPRAPLNRHPRALVLLSARGVYQFAIQPEKRGGVMLLRFSGWPHPLHHRASLIRAQRGLVGKCDIDKDLQDKLDSHPMPIEKGAQHAAVGSFGLHNNFVYVSLSARLGTYATARNMPFEHTLRADAYGFCARAHPPVPRCRKCVSRPT